MTVCNAVTAVFVRFIPVKEVRAEERQNVRLRSPIVIRRMAFVAARIVVFLLGAFAQRQHLSAGQHQTALIGTVMTRVVRVAPARIRPMTAVAAAKMPTVMTEMRVRTMPVT